jgi:hypothetical protein
LRLVWRLGSELGWVSVEQPQETPLRRRNLQKVRKELTGPTAQMAPKEQKVPKACRKVTPTGLGLEQNRSPSEVGYKCTARLSLVRL